jgi:hypothetical protein
MFYIPFQKNPGTEVLLEAVPVKVVLVLGLLLPAV